jgi:hypothetical protein
MATVQTKEYTVTEGNFVADPDVVYVDSGVALTPLQKGAGDKVRLTDEQAAPLKKLRIIE